MSFWEQMQGFSLQRWNLFRRGQKQFWKRSLPWNIPLNFFGGTMFLVLLVFWDLVAARRREGDS